MTEEVYENFELIESQSRRTSLSLELKNIAKTMINNFFMNGDCSKMSELREAHNKSLNEMEEVKKFQNSTFDTIARRKLVEDQDTILELHWQDTGIAKMKFIVYMIQKIFRMLNQYAVEIPTLPVDQCHSHLIQFLKEC